jgi:hypothetical protein
MHWPLLGGAERPQRPFSLRPKKVDPKVNRDGRMSRGLNSEVLTLIWFSRQSVHCVRALFVKHPCL